MNDRSRHVPLKRRALGVVVPTALSVSLLTVSTAAQAPDALPIDLGWEAPASCPESDDLERDVRRLLGDAPIPENLPPITARVSVRENADGTFQVRVRTQSGSEERERELRTETCAEAQHLVAFLLAFLINPNAREPPPTEAPPATSAPPVSAPPRTEPPRPPPEPAPAPVESSPRWVAGFLVSADYGTLPSVSLGGELRAGLLFSGWSLEGRAAGWLPRRAESATTGGAGGQFSLFDAGAVGCLRSAPWEAPSIQVCAGPVVMWLRGEGYGVETPGHDDALFAGVMAEGALGFALSSQLSLRPALGALVPFRRPTFAIHGIGEIHRPSVASARAWLGFEVKF